MDRILIVEDDETTAEAVAGEVRALACEPVIGCRPGKTHRASGMTSAP